MIIDSIDIGGAETHLVNLVEVLNNENIECFVASSGGIYQKDLLDMGVRHFDLPINSKNPLDLFLTISKLIKKVKVNKIDIIHSHGRMPAFIGNIVSKFTSVRFMTTAHAKVEANSLYKHITTYGEFVISVSNDIKKHIVDKFGVSASNIEIIPNGINIDKFRKKDIDIDFLKDNNLKKDSIKLMIVSRMDGQLGQLAIDLVNNIDKIKSKSLLELIVVGDGDRFDEINDLGKNKDNVKILGKRNDIDKILNVSDIVVAVSRSALEAMACEKIVVLAGGEGYLGLFNEKIVDKAILDNFTGRNCKDRYKLNVMIKDIEKAINLLGTDREEDITHFSREVVKREYSLERSMIKTIEIYKKLLGGKYE